MSEGSAGRDVCALYIYILYLLRPKTAIDYHPKSIDYHPKSITFHVPLRRSCARKVAKDTVEQWLGHAMEVATTRTVEQRRVAHDSLGRVAARGLVREVQQTLVPTFEHTMYMQDEHTIADEKMLDMMKAWISAGSEGYYYEPCVKKKGGSGYQQELPQRKRPKSAAKVARGWKSRG